MAEGTAWATYDVATPVTRAALEYTTMRGVWKDRVWETTPAALDAAAGKVSAKIPASATVYYLNLFDAGDRVVSSEHEVVAE